MKVVVIANRFSAASETCVDMQPAVKESEVDEK